MSQQPQKYKRRERPSFIWPLVLITIGIVFLLSNLGIFKGDIWENIWQFWPVILVAIGLDGLFRRNEIAGPVFMIGLGVVFQLGNLGVIGWGTWDILWRLWPILLVAVGLEIIVGRRSLWISILSVILILAILGGVVWYLGPGPVSGETLVGNQVDQPLGELQDAEIVISPAIGELNVKSMKDPSLLISGEVSAGKNQQIYADYEVRGTTGYYEIDSSSAMYSPSSVGWDWDLSLTDGLPLGIELNMGVGDLNADLSGLVLTDVEVDQAVGEVSVVLSEQGDYRVDISQAIGSMIVEIPDDIGIRLEISKAISSLSMPAGFEQVGDYYYSANYDGAVTKVELKISQAIGSILVQYR